MTSANAQLVQARFNLSTARANLLAAPGSPMKKVLAVAALAVFIGALIYVEKSRGAGQGALGGPAGAG